MKGVERWTSTLAGCLGWLFLSEPQDFLYWGRPRQNEPVGTRAARHEMALIEMPCGIWTWSTTTRVTRGAKTGMESVDLQAL